MTVAVIITAAGSGSRLGKASPKALVPLAGVPILTHALRGVAAAGIADVVVVTAPKDHLDDVAELAPEVICVRGGHTRQESVENALAVLPDEVEYVLVHDAARPLTPPEVFQTVLAALREGRGAVIPAVPVTDTVKRARPVGGIELVTGTVERSELRAVQTPQGFERALLAEAHAAGKFLGGEVGATDDAGLVEALGVDVWLIPGSERSLKITGPQDLALAELLAQQ